MMLQVKVIPNTIYTSVTDYFDKKTQVTLKLSQFLVVGASNDLFQKTLCTYNSFTTKYIFSPTKKFVLNRAHLSLVFPMYVRPC